MENEIQQYILKLLAVGQCSAGEILAYTLKEFYGKTDEDAISNVMVKMKRSGKIIAIDVIYIIN